MPAPVLFADMHCHPTLRPYGQSFSGNGSQSPDPASDTSLWHRDTPNRYDLWLEGNLGLPRFRQSALHSAAIGGTRLLCLSLGSMEREFCIQGNDLLNNTPLGRWLTDSITGIGQARIRFLRQLQRYFGDFLNELRFLQQAEGQPVTLGGKQYRYRLVSNGSDLARILEDNAAPGNTVETIAVVLSAEGLHIIDQKPENMDTLQQLQARPFFITFCHHFYNGLCGHARSLIGITGNINSQSSHLGEPFTALGVTILKKMLDNSQGRRILVDMKHMSRKGREQYFRMIQGARHDSIIPGSGDATPVFRFNMRREQGLYTQVPPAVVSHGAVNGIAHPGTQEYHGNESVNPFANAGNDQRSWEINFYDDEILNLVQYGGGMFGIQLDERRIAGSLYADRYPKDIRGRTRLIWQQIVHIVELLDLHNIEHAWNYVCIGSDFDGLIDPLRGIYTYEDFPRMREHLILHASAYLRNTAGQPRRRPTDGTKPNRLNLPSNLAPSAETIIDKFCFRNFADFCIRHFV